MTKHTKAQLVFEWGLIRTTNGLNIARMDRNEPGTSPTERDSNAKRFVRMWNLWDDIDALLTNLLVDHGQHDLRGEDSYYRICRMRTRMREEQ